MLDLHDRRVFVSLTLALLVATTGCLGSGVGGESSATPTAESSPGPGGEESPSVATDTDSAATPTAESELMYRLVLVPEDEAEPTVGVRIATANDNATVYTDSFELTGERDLSRHLNGSSAYTVDVTVSGTTSTYTIFDYEGYRLHIDANGVQVVESVME